jgi:hypothetical protein
MAEDDRAGAPVNCDILAALVLGISIPASEHPELIRLGLAEHSETTDREPILAITRNGKEFLRVERERARREVHEWMRRKPETG